VFIHNNGEMEAEWSFDDRADTYDMLTWVHDQSLLRTMVNLISEGALLRARTILDVATGTGAVARALAREKGHLIGLDLSRPMLERAAHRHSLAKVWYLRARGEVLPIKDGTIDILICRNGLHQMLEPGLALREFGRVLSPFGLICVIESVAPPDPVKSYWRKIILLKDRGRHPDFTFTARELEAWIEEYGLDVLRVVSKDVLFDVDEWITMGGVTGARAEEVRQLFERADTGTKSEMGITWNDGQLLAKKVSHMVLARPRA
jgi:ubiquinone/menaquinone biosynthesis C-methylase UbiE